MKDNQGKKKKYWLIPLIVLFTAAIGVAGYYIWRDLSEATVAIHTLGEPEITVEYGTFYKDKGAAAVASSKLGGSRKLDIAVLGSVDTKTVGDYELEYQTTFLGTTYTSSRTVHVKDTNAPVITAEYDGDIEGNWITGPRKTLVKAIDEYDGDISDKVVSKKSESGKTIYSVSDSSGNTAEIEWMEEERVAAPEIIFDDGASEVTMYIGEDAGLSGYYALDGGDNDCTPYIEEVGSYDVNTPGTYEILYTMSNNADEIVEALRTVHVVQRMNPDYIADMSKIIYLTFDGGPGEYSADILDLMDKYNVKASFFVQGANATNSSLINRIKRSGHMLGILSDTKDYFQLFLSEDSYMEDLDKMEAIVYWATGEETPFIRFPGGSQNGYAFEPYFMTELINKLYSEGYRYFDWNIDPGDGINTKESVYQSVINSVRQGEQNIVLLHDSNRVAWTSLENIILWGLRNGYTFAALA